MLQKDISLIEKQVSRLEGFEQSLEAQQKARQNLFAEALELEDAGKPVDKAMSKLKDLDNELELAKKRIEKAQADLKNLITISVDNELQNLDKDLAGFKKVEKEYMLLAGESIALAEKYFYALGAGFSDIGPRLQKIFRMYTGEVMCDYSTIESGRAAEQTEVEPLHQRRSEIAKLKSLKEHPTNRPHFEKRLYVRAIRHDLND